MSRRVLDTSVLIQFWKQRRTKDSQRTPTIEQAGDWAKELIDVRKCDVIVSPVAIEFVAGSQNQQEVALFREFIGQFNIIDQGRISPVDWERARQRAERVPRDGRRRQLGDCLILAIAERLHLDVDSLDARF